MAQLVSDIFDFRADLPGGEGHVDVRLPAQEKRQGPQNRLKSFVRKDQCKPGQNPGRDHCTPVGDKPGGWRAQGQEKPSYKQTLAKFGSMTLASMAKAAGTVGHYEHVAKEWLSSGAKAAVEALPSSLQPIVKGAWGLVRLGTSAAFITYTAGQKLAEEVCKAKAGGTEEGCKKLRTALSVVDITAAKPAILAAEILFHNPVAAGVVGMIPLGSLAYLASSTATNPLATLKGAVNAVAGLVKRRKKAMGEELNPQQLAEGIAEFVGEDDSKLALFLVALERVNDASEALEIAREASQGHPGTVIKSRIRQITKGQGEPCQQGETQASTHCIPKNPAVSGSSSGPSEQPKPVEHPQPKTPTGFLPDGMTGADAIDEATSWLESSPIGEQVDQNLTRLHDGLHEESDDVALEGVRDVLRGTLTYFTGLEKSLLEVGVTEEAFSEMKTEIESFKAEIKTRLIRYHVNTKLATEARAVLEELDSNEPPTDGELPESEIPPEPEEPDVWEDLEQPDDPEFPDEPEEPDEPEFSDDEPVREDWEGENADEAFAEALEDYETAKKEFEQEHEQWEKDHKQWEKDHDKWEKTVEKIDSDYEKEVNRVDTENEKGQAKYDKAYEKWESAHEKWESKVEKLQEKYQAEIEKIHGEWQEKRDEVESQIDEMDSNNQDYASTEIHDFYSEFVSDKIGPWVTDLLEPLRGEEPREGEKPVPEGKPEEKKGIPNKLKKGKR